MRPIIGVTGADFIPEGGTTTSIRAGRTYLEAVWKAGGLPVILDLEAEQAGELALRLDGLLLSGGGDIDPALFGAERHPKTSDIKPLRDAAEFALVLAFQERSKPILGICRGMQVVAAALGGTLHQHVPDLPNVRHNHSDPATLHAVRLEPGTQLRAVFGREEVTSNSTHHQAVERVPEGFVICATSDDGLVEAIERGNMLCTQWHPERAAPEAHRGIFEYFVGLCSELRKLP